MKEYKITYHRGSDILVENIHAENTLQAIYLFNMKYHGVDDIKSVEEVE